MKNFIVLFKPIQAPMQMDAKKLSADYIQMDFLLSEMMKSNPGMGVDISKNYEIDEKSISFQTIGGHLCVVFLAFRK